MTFFALFDLQVCLSTEDLKMIVEESSTFSCSCSIGQHGTVDIKTFLAILEHSTW